MTRPRSFIFLVFIRLILLRLLSLFYLFHKFLVKFTYAKWPSGSKSSGTSHVMIHLLIIISIFYDHRLILKLFWWVGKILIFQRRFLNDLSLVHNLTLLKLLLIGLVNFLLKFKRKFSFNFRFTPGNSILSFGYNLWIIWSRTKILLIITFFIISFNLSHNRCWDIVIWTQFSGVRSKCPRLPKWSVLVINSLLFLYNN